MENKKEIFVIRPSKQLNIGRIERDENKLQEMYNLGVNDCNNILEDLKKYINNQGDKNEEYEIYKDRWNDIIDSLAGKWMETYTKLYEVNLTEVRPNNYWYITSGVIERQLVYASFKRTAYEVILLDKYDQLEVERAFFYVDAYTGQVIAGNQMSDQNYNQIKIFF